MRPRTVNPTVSFVCTLSCLTLCHLISQASAEDAAREGSQPADGPLLPGSSNVAAQAGRTGAASPAGEGAPDPMEAPARQQFPPAAQHAGPCPAGAAQAEAMLQPAHHLPAPAPAPGSHVPAADSAAATNDGDGELVRDLVQQMMQRVVQATEGPRTGTSSAQALPASASGAGSGDPSQGLTFFWVLQRHVCRQTNVG